MNLEKMTPSIRYLAEMTEVLFDKEWAKTAPDLKLYYMYRDIIMNKEEHQIIKKAGLLKAEKKAQRETKQAG